jgi:N-methylhydantoinase B/oxoprolinase/acetone carboxylase alpha subunit
MRIETPCGGGAGTTADRSPERVAEDRRSGKVME